jgi:uncharacterized protein (UPF0548 family)
MRIFFRPPSQGVIEPFLSDQRDKPFSYVEVGKTRGAPPSGYDLDHHRIELGRGEEVFQLAMEALRGWRMFQCDWVTLCWPDVPISPGEVVGVLIRAYGLWSLNACRIVYLVDEHRPIRRYGFAYGTLPGHGERGEERFLIEQGDDGVVRYDLYAFSRPRHWSVRLGYPLARRLQERFARCSLQAMRTAVMSPGEGQGG